MDAQGYSLESERLINLSHALGISQFERNTRLREAQVYATLAQVAEQAELERLHRELDEAQRFVTLVIAAVGGEVRISSQLMVDPPKEISRWDDLSTGETVLRTR